MLEGVTAKDWLTTVPAWIGMVTGCLSLALVWTKDLRDARLRRPRLTVGVEMQIKEVLWEVYVGIENVSPTPLTLDVIHVYAPLGVSLVPRMARGDFEEALAKEGERSLPATGGMIEPGAKGGWRGYLRAEAGCTPFASVTIGAEVRMISDRERKRVLKSTRSMPT